MLFSYTRKNTHARTCLCNGVYVLFLTQTHTQIFPVFFNGRSYEVVLTRFFFLEKIFLKLFFYFFNFCFFFVAVDSLSKEKGKLLFFFSKKNVYVFFIALFYDVVFVVIFCSLVASLSSLCRSHSQLTTHSCIIH